MVRAKFKVNEITYTENGAKLLLTPVTKTTPENESFFKWTPAGRLEMQIVSLDTAKNFEVGKEYYVDFTLAKNVTAEGGK